MADVKILHIVLLTLATLVGLALGWLLRGSRAVQEREALDAVWKERLEALRIDHRRLTEQYRALLEQASRHEASHADASNQARELAAALKEAFQRREQLQGQIRDIRGDLEAVLAERRKLESSVKERSESDSQLARALKERDEKIFRLSRELDSWQGRLPPLLTRFRDRDDDAKRLEAALDRANERILELETGRGAGQTHVESVRRDALSGELDASNDARGEASGYFAAALASLESPRYYDATLRFDADPAGLYDGRDDLKAIKGIGPAIEKTLHELGIFHYSQIAEMSEYDINRVAERLKGFRSRIYREDWIGQARDLIYRRGRHSH